MRTYLVLVAGLLVAGCGRSAVDAFEVLSPRVPLPNGFPGTNPTPAPTPTAGPFCDPADADLGACYRFESNGADESQYVVNAALTSVAFAPFNNGDAAELSAGSGIEVADSIVWDGPELTVEMFVRADSLPATGRAGLLDKDGQMGIFLRPDGRIYCVSGGVGLVTTTNAIATAVWTHVACVIAPTTIALHLDGVLDAAAIPTGGIGANGGPIRVGEDSPSGNDQLLGGVDSLRVWRRARTVAEICAAAGSC